MHPPGNEKPGLQAGLLSDDPETIEQSARRVNGKAAPPLGTGWADVGKGEVGRLEPVTHPPTERGPLTKEQILLRTIGHACGWSDGNPVRWTAFLIVAGFDTRPVSEVAKSLRVSPRLLQMRVAECREWLAELRAEMEAQP